MTKYKRMWRKTLWYIVEKNRSKKRQKNILFLFITNHWHVLRTSTKSFKLTGNGKEKWKISKWNKLNFIDCNHIKYQLCVHWFSYDERWYNITSSCSVFRLQYVYSFLDYFIRLYSIIRTKWRNCRNNEIMNIMNSIF